MGKSDGGERKDKRSTRTKNLLADTILAMLQRHAFSDITVNDICIEAEVSRATFYLYFEDKYHLMVCAMARLSGQIGARAPSGELRDVLDTTLQVLEENRRALHNLTVADGNRELLSMLHKTLVADLARLLEAQAAAGTHFAVPIPVLSVFYAAGLSYLIVWWLEGGFAASREEMVAYLLRMAKGESALPPGNTP